MVRWQNLRSPKGDIFPLFVLLSFVYFVGLTFELKAQSESETSNFAEADSEAQFTFSDIQKGQIGKSSDTLVYLKIRFKKVEEPFSLANSKLEVAINGIKGRHPAYVSLTPVSGWEKRSGKWVLSIPISEIRFEDEISVHQKLKKILKKHGRVKVSVVALKHIQSAELVFVRGGAGKRKKIPTVTIDFVQPSENPTASQSIVFTFHSPKGSTSFECAFDSEEFKPCTSPVSYSHLLHGSHIFNVRALSNTNVPGKSAGYHFEVIGRNLQFSIQKTVPAESPTNSDSISVYFISDNAKSYCQLDGRGFHSCLSPVTFSGLGQGSHTVQIYAVAGKFQSNTATYSWVVDKTPPVIQWAHTPMTIRNETIAYFGIIASEPVTLQCSLDGDPYTPCDPTFSFSQLNDGTHILNAVATDLAGNTRDVLTYHWTIDLTPPTIIVSAINPAQNPTNVSTLSVSFSASEGASFQCGFDDGTLLPCHTPFVVDNLSEGLHNLSITATDLAKNQSVPFLYLWRVDRTSPTVNILLLSPLKLPTFYDSAKFQLVSSEEANLRCLLDLQSLATCNSPLELFALQEGNHRLTVTPTDTAGNAGVSSFFDWVIDRTPPSITILDITPSQKTTDSTSMRISFTTSEISQTRCDLDLGGRAPCESPFIVNNLAEGSHAITLNATDNAGNSSDPWNYSWTVSLQVTATIDRVTPAEKLTSQRTVTFEFSSSNAVSFVCSLDQSSFTPCSSPLSFTNLVTGSHTFEVRGVNSLGNVGSGEIYSWTVDSAPPIVTITSVDPPNSSTSSTILTINWTANKPVQFYCSTDSGSPSLCSSPFTTPPLAEGQHTFLVYAKDSAGNQSPQVSYRWTIDTTPPQLSILTTDPASSPTNRKDLTLTFASNETVTPFCSLDMTPFTTCSSPYTVSQLSDGNHTLTLFVKDQAGNESSRLTYDWQIDSVAPVVTITSADPLSGRVNVRYMFLSFSADKPSSFFCALDKNPYYPCTSPYRVYDLVDDSHLIAIYAVDALGNRSAVTYYDWLLDATAPIPYITSTDPNTSVTNLTTMTVNISSNEVTNKFCSIDQNPFFLCFSPTTVNNLTNGPHVFYLYVEDSFYNRSPTVSYHWTVDNKPPQASITSTDPSLSPTNRTSLSVFFTADKDAQFLCSLDGAVLSSCSSPYMVSGLAEGSHVVSVIAQDSFGNRGVSASYSWMVDTVAPEVSILSTDPGAALTSRNYLTISFMANESASFYCALDALPELPCSSPATFSNLFDGNHSITIFAVDSAGNGGPSASHSWTVDSSPLMTTNVAVTQITQTSALVSWHTNRVATSQVLYGTGGVLSQGTVVASNPVNEHSVLLTDLKRFTFHSFQTESVDFDGRQSLSDILGFRTLR